MVVADEAVLVDQVFMRPVAVAEGAPRRVIVVLYYRIADAMLGHSRNHIVIFLLEREFRGMHADDDQSFVPIFSVPVREIRKSADAIDARIGPKVNQHDLAPEIRDPCPFRGIYVASDALKLRSFKIPAFLVLDSFFGRFIYYIILFSIGGIFCNVSL